MANGKEKVMPVASNDFQKSNGTVSSDHAFHTEGPSMTRQEMAAECDINTIMAQYDKYISDPMMLLRQQGERYLPLDEMPQTLMESMQILQDASQAFYSLPAVVRKEFDNDPVAFTDYALDPNNIDQMRDWGLARPKPVEAPPQKVEVVAGAAPGGASAPSGAAPAAGAHGST